MPGSQTAPAGSEAKGQRARAIVAAAHQILEERGHEELTMWRLGAAVGICSPSLYKHLRDKAAVQLTLIEEGFENIAGAFDSARVVTPRHSCA